VQIGGYTAFVLSAFQDLYWSYICLTALVVVVFGYVAATASAGRRKGRASLIAALTFSSFFLISPALWTFYESRLPVFEADGMIAAVQVRDHSSRHYSAQLWIKTGDAGEVSVHVSDRSSAWHVGQRLKVRYYGDTGELIRANLISSDGHPQGTVRNSFGFTRAVSVLLGVALMWIVLKRYRRDPEALMEDRPELSNVSVAVDQDSLLHLSEPTTPSEMTGSR